MALSPEAIAAKNRLSDDGIWVCLLYLQSPETTPTILHMTNHTSDVIWNGVKYVAFPFALDEFKEGIKGELPTLSIKVSNVNRMMQGYIEADATFGSGWEANVYFIYVPKADLPADDTANDPIQTDRDAELVLEFVTKDVSCDENYCTLTLGIGNPLRFQLPFRKFSPNHCQADFKVAETGCPYAGDDDTCEKTLQACREKFPGMGTPIPFVGFPEMPSGHGVYKV